MGKKYGWAGTVLRMDLSTGVIEKTDSAKYYSDDFIGGRAMAARIYWDEVSPQPIR
jgi:aldehyde:ferredoxin oxidoreductase